MKKWIRTLLVSTLLLVLSFGMFSEVHAQTFSDIGNNHPDKAKIDRLVEKGVISGYSDGTFRPNTKVSRAEFAAFIARALDLPEASSSFKDVSKSSALYSEVSKAYKAGIIMGFKDGTFKPNINVSRADMAVMLDRAMQLKGNYSKTTSLSYSDAGSIGAYALESVKRMTAYHVMGSSANTNKFNPSLSGTRLETVVSVYNMLEAITTNTPEKPSPGKKDSEMTIAELTQKYGTHKMISRSRATHNFYETDLISHYHLYYKTMAKDFPDYMDMMRESYSQQYNAYYPYIELISYNGKSYKSSEIYFEDLRAVDDAILPMNPESSSHFLIDIHLNSKDTATYLKDNVLTKTMANLPYQSNGDVMVDIETLLKAHLKVTTSSSKLTINNNGKIVEFTDGSKNVLVNGQSTQLKTAVKKTNGKFMVPIRESAALLGLYTRGYTGTDVKLPNTLMRIDIANYPLPADYKKSEYSGE